jgi:hypothetical protein
VTDPSAHPPRRTRGADPASPADPDDPSTVDEDASAAGRPDHLDLTGFPIIGITRRRVGWASAGFAAVWIVVVFARQVGDAQAATNRAAQLAADNAALAAEVDALQRETDMIVRPEYVGLEARSYRFGNAKEIPFTLDPAVPAPVDGAPGSASVRLGATVDRQTPFESWLSILFGPGD